MLSCCPSSAMSPGSWSGPSGPHGSDIFWSQYSRARFRKTLLPRFTQVVERAFGELEAGNKLLLECGFYVEHRLFDRRLPSVIAAMLSNQRGDGHNAPKKQSMKPSEDASFDY